MYKLFYDNFKGFWSDKPLGNRENSMLLTNYFSSLLIGEFLAYFQLNLSKIINIKNVSPENGNNFPLYGDCHRVWLFSLKRGCYQNKGSKYVSRTKKDNYFSQVQGRTWELIIKKKGKAESWLRGAFEVNRAGSEYQQERPGWNNTVEVHFSLICSLCNLRKRAIAFSDHCLSRELFFLVSRGEFFSEALAVHQKMNRIWTVLSFFSLWLTILTLPGIQTCHILMKSWISQL